MTGRNAPTPNDSLESFRLRAYRHAVEDGAIDLVVGVFTLIVGAATQRRIFRALALVYFTVMASAWKPLHSTG